MYYYKYKDGTWNDGAFNNGYTQKDVSIFICEWDEVNNERDMDGDGIPDDDERNGMLLANGQIIYSDPYKADTDGDGLSDYEEMGGRPVKKRLPVKGADYDIMIWNMKSNPNETDSDGDGYEDKEDRYPLVKAAHYLKFGKADAYDKDYRSDLRKNFNEDYGTGEYTWEQKVYLYNMKTELFTLAYNAQVIIPNAAKMMMAYLKNSIDDYEIQVKNLLFKSKNAGTLFAEYFHKINEHVESVLKENDEIIITTKKKIVTHDYEDLVQAILDMDWMFSIGKSSGIIVAKAKREENVIKVKMKYIVYDYYDWDPNNEEVAIWRFRDCDIYQLHHMGIAKHYNVYGDYEIEYTLHIEE